MLLMDDIAMLNAPPPLKKKEKKNESKAKQSGPSKSNNKWLLLPISYLISISEGRMRAANCDYFANCISKI